MKLVLVFITLTAFATSLPYISHMNRRFEPEENDPYRFKYITTVDSEGNQQIEDLTHIPPKLRLDQDEVTIYLYTQENLDEGIELKLENSENLETFHTYNQNRDNFFIIHGWNNNYESDVNEYIKGAILHTADVNVFVVDWSGPANKGYLTAFSAIPHVGKFVGTFINEIIENNSLSPKQFKLIGHSLGAHVAGCAGATVKGSVDFIIGLDPAGPLFTLPNTENRLDTSDADFVQVIHTSLLGFVSSIGHADYYPNDGIKQPGCGLDLVSICSHSRSILYYEESILYGGFTAKRCNDYIAFLTGKCDDNDDSFIGTLNIDTSASGDYYLKTARDSPFSLE